MKKLLLATAVGLVASFAPAAAVQWSSGSFDNGFNDHNGASLANSTAYTMTVLFFSDSEGKNPIAVTGNSVAEAKPNGAYRNTTSDSFANSTTEKTQTYWVKAIIQGKDGEGKDYYREAALVSFNTQTSGDANLNFTTGAGFTEGGLKWDAGGWQEGTPPEPVPEPTSGMLLLLGMAGLMLKRKRA